MASKFFAALLLACAFLTGHAQAQVSPLVEIRNVLSMPGNQGQACNNNDKPSDCSFVDDLLAFGKLDMQVSVISGVNASGEVCYDGCLYALGDDETSFRVVWSFSAVDQSRILKLVPGSPIVMQGEVNAPTTLAVTYFSDGGQSVTSVNVVSGPWTTSTIFPYTFLQGVTVTATVAGIACAISPPFHNCSSMLSATAMNVQMVSAIPEPTTFALFSIGILLIGMKRRQRIV